MWHQIAQPYVKSGELAILGVVQEQHAERAQLYRQWKQYDFPILQDANTQLGLSAVPIPLLIDQHGIVRNNRPRPNDLAAFMKQTFQTADSSGGLNEKESIPAVRPEETDLAKLLRQGNDLINAKQAARISDAIGKFQQAVDLDPNSGQAAFSLGVAYRMRFDSEFAVESDFESASKYWSRALAINPNQYIWRRRIEQYGPRQIKPYPFYNWVDTAIAEISQRGQTPIELSVKLTGSERAVPSKTFTAQIERSDAPTNPDPGAKIRLDDDKVLLNVTAVPAAVKPGQTVRIHLHLKPEDCKWNNEAAPMTVWIDSQSDGTPELQLIEYPGPKSPSSKEHRLIDFEFKTSEKTTECSVTGFILFHSCDDRGTCYFNRKNFSVPVGIK